MIYVNILQDNNNKFTERQKEIDKFYKKWYDSDTYSSYIRTTSKINKDVEKRMHDLLSLLIQEYDCYNKEVSFFLYYILQQNPEKIDYKKIEPITKENDYQIINRIEKDMLIINSEILNRLKNMLEAYNTTYQLYLFYIL